MRIVLPIRRLHPVAGGLALATILLFQAMTVLVETLGGPADIAAVKTAILWGIPVLVLAIATAGATGARLSAPAPERSAHKRARMRLVALNGLFVLVPAAVILAAKARANEVDGVFYVVQMIEFAAGAINMVLLARTMRDGFAMTARRRAALVAALAAASVVTTAAALAGDWVEVRTAGFKEVKAAVGRIDGALSDGRLDQVGADARALAAFAARIASLFPPGSGQGGQTSASAEIWTRFADFTERSDALRRYAEALAAAAEAGDLARAEDSFSDLRSTCKPCHRRYKDVF